MPTELTPERYLRMATESVGMPAPEPTAERLRAHTTMHERPCWDAEVPLDPIAAAGFPVLVVRGDWSGAPAEHRRLAGEPLMITAQVVAERLGAELLTVPGFYPQVQQPAALNELGAGRRELTEGALARHQRSTLQG